MTQPEWEACYFGPSAAVREQFAQILGVTVHAGLPAAAAATNCAFFDAGAGADVLGDLPGGNVFAACRLIKDRRRWRVYFLVRPEDRITPEIARFCLADGCFVVGPEGLVNTAEEVRERIGPHRPRIAVEELLNRLEQEIASDAGRQASALQRMLADVEGESLLDRLVDPETGLFDGPFASFKLDEEFKRSMRFHQPLSLLLLDIGIDLGAAFADADIRREFLAGIASVFLNECRDIDIIGRFTESTFMVMMPGTGAAGAEILARRMLEGVRKREAADGAAGSPSAGLATMPAAGIQNRQGFLARAEACLRLAREGRGHDGFCSYSE